MARILIDGQWYEEIALASLYETEVEELLLSQSSFLYPGYFTIPFKVIVSSEDGSAKPDFALVDKAYREWWVVEVEMAHHSLAGHVLPQVRTLSRAAYGREQAMHLCRQCASADLGQVVDMMKGKQPRVLIVVNSPRPDWQKDLSAYDASMAVFEIFRSDRNHHIFRVNGEQPQALVGIVSLCSLDPILPRLLKVDSPACLGIKHNERVSIRYGNTVCEWDRTDTKTDVWLSPVSANPLSPKVRYELVRRDDGSLEIKEHNS